MNPQLVQYIVENPYDLNIEINKNPTTERFSVTISKISNGDALFYREDVEHIGFGIYIVVDFLTFVLASYVGQKQVNILTTGMIEFLANHLRCIPRMQTSGFTGQSL